MFRSIFICSSFFACAFHLYAALAPLNKDQFPSVFARPEVFERRYDRNLSALVKANCFHEKTAPRCGELRDELSVLSDFRLQAFPYNSRMRLDQARFAYFMNQDSQRMNKEILLSTAFSSKNQFIAAQRYAFGFFVLKHLSDENKLRRKDDYALVSER